jgi:glucokinase
MTQREAPLPREAIVADIGGTNARFAVADLSTLDLSHISQVLCAAHPTFAAAFSSYLAELPGPLDHVAIAVAAPVTGEDIHLTNSPWSFAKHELCRAAGLKDVLVLNDFEALALSLPHLARAEIHQIGGAAPEDHATKLVLGPGTGLGVAGLVWSGERWIAVPGEGGHASLGAHDERELALLERLRKGRSHLSAERALSGPGLAALYQAIAASYGEGPAELEPNDVLMRALSGEDRIAVEALDVFMTWLGRFAGDAALLFGARGGVYLGGGIAPKIASALSSGAFRAAFEQKGRMVAYLAPIPVYVILAGFATLKGAAAALGAVLGPDTADRAKSLDLT